MNFLFCALKSTNKLRKDGASSSVWKVALSKSMSLEKKTSLTKGALRMQMNWCYYLIVLAIPCYCYEYHFLWTFTLSISGNYRKFKFVLTVITIISMKHVI